MIYDRLREIVEREHRERDNDQRHARTREDEQQEPDAEQHKCGDREGGADREVALLVAETAFAHTGSVPPRDTMDA